MTEQLWGLITFAGAIHGILLTALLGSRRTSRTSQLVAGLTLVFSLMLLEEMVDALGLYRSVPHALLLTTPLSLAIGPLVLFMARQITGLAAQRRIWLHFMPMLIAYAVLTPFYFSAADTKLQPWTATTLITIDVLVVIKLIHLLLYEAASLRLLGRTSAGSSSAANWIKTWVIVSVVIVVVIHVWHFVDLVPIETWIDSDRLGSLFLAASTYLLGILLILHPSVLEASDGPQQLQYRTSRLSSEELDALANRLDHYMRSTQAYTNPSLSLDDLAAGSEMTSHTVSQVLSQALELNFYQYVNGFRVDAVKEALKDETGHDQKLLNLAFDAGFNSKSSFNRAFKAHTGMTPSTFRNKNRRTVPGGM